MKKISGYVLFEGKNDADLGQVFKEFRLNQSKTFYFTSRPGGAVKTGESGIFLAGEVNNEYTSANIAKILRKLMGLPIDRAKDNLGLENENKFFFAQGSVQLGHYFCLRFLGLVEKKEREKFFQTLKKKTSYFCWREKLWPAVDIIADSPAAELWVRAWAGQAGWETELLLSASLESWPARRM